jgi:hypothetical protein
VIDKLFNERNAELPGGGKSKARAEKSFEIPPPCETGRKLQPLFR